MSRRMRVNGVASDTELKPEVLERLVTFGKMNVLKKEALKVIAASLPNQELQGIKEMFMAIDEDGSKTITIDELREGLRKKGASLASSEVEKVGEVAFFCNVMGVGGCNSVHTL